MAIQRYPVKKRCEYLGLDPATLGYSFKSRTARAAAKPAPRRKQSAYALQLKEKQKVKFVYGVMERQFRRLFERSSRMAGSTGENLLSLMESRLDNAVYRLGFAKTRAQARQLVSHRHVGVNGRRVNVPSRTVEVGDVISLLEGPAPEPNRPAPAWFALDPATGTATVLRSPSRADVDFDVRESMIVELYSK